MDNIITVTAENIDREHICCAISDKKGETCVFSKKVWMKERFEDGLVFRKLDIRGKVFIEYIPAEKAWCPIDAPGYMYINCFWVSGQFKGKGHANHLLEECIEDAKAKGCCGLTVVASKKKRPFLSDPDYLKYKGFRAADTAEPFFILYYLPLTENAPVPKFKECAKQGKIEEKGMVLYYTNQCPHTDKYVPLIVNLAKKRGAQISVHKIETTEQAQSTPTPFSTYGFFYDGVFLTNEIFGPAKFEKFMDQNGF
ncbi:GNAT family N-acetyltransferase [Caproiciproducens sp.]|uniref:GNAT family N-acetyltransferase n=1 Tax=Caproiciproducens sp. TaxID=1954376 RepID=UPI0028A18966|nr:GNAT family N-acetyltransferase [Caproiciproducens sp.]